MRPIVVYAPTFDENIGGVIALHYLVDRLRAIGFKAYIHPIVEFLESPQGTGPTPVQILRTMWRNHLRRKEGLERFQTHPSMNTPIASWLHILNGVAVYPEIVSGNPVRAKGVARWLLHKPGFINKDAIFNDGELTFYYQDAFREGLDWVDPDNHLCVRWVRDDIYFDHGLQQREGACRLVRKGKLTGSLPPDNDDAIPIDGMTHTEKAEVFNRTRYLYSHDPYTMYTFYAALCGCVPVVMPQPGLSAEDWHATYPYKNGVAYGMKEAEWAARTRGELLAEFADQISRDEEMVRRFALKVQHHFKRRSLFER